MVQRFVWLSRVDESFPALPGSFAADKFVFLKVSINSAWGPFFESNGRNTPPTYFSFTSVKTTADVPIRGLKDLLRLAARIDHKRIWRPHVIQDRKLQVKNLLRSRVAQEKRKRQKVTASVQTHYKLNSSPACCAKRSPPHVLDCLATSEPAIIIIVKSQMLVTFTGHL